MNDELKPSLEFNRGPALWGAATLVILCTLAIFVLNRPGWMVPASFVAGAVAGFRSGPYDQAATNGLVAAGVGMVGLIPVFAGRRLLEFRGVETAGDLYFLAGTLVVSDLVVAMLFMPILGYVGAIGGDILRDRRR